MTNDYLIPLPDLCTQYEMEMSFFINLEEYGLIEFISVEETYFIHKDHIVNLEKILRLHQELNLNLEGIDTVFNLLHKIDILKTELNDVKNRLRRYENE
ncbi:chaperone modulator CbpM [Winogradskyella aurantia]|uniref:MerR family transcriptional regulator n=1 Tax=Winogradskyella aurantia TaxID=1915063 RepID=A0A265UNT6_9FLAO|nr:chaperone modulator CbpM [Winogradskyella aurantia]OZV66909.1 MerR family transcriptional regulator [Winogradskyella aurantia]